MNVRAILKDVKGFVKDRVTWFCVAPGGKIGSSRWNIKAREKLSNDCWLLFIVFVQALSHVRLSGSHRLQHARPPCPSPTPRVYSESCQYMSEAYVRLWIFLPAILIPACASSSAAFQMIYSAYKLNRQGDNIQPWHTPFPIWNQSVVPYPVLTIASYSAYRFLRGQVRWSGIPISWRIFHSLLWST